MYRHTTPVPLKFFAENGPEGEAEIPLMRSERDAESVWGDYPGRRIGVGRYVDLHYEGIPIGRLWGTDTTVGLLHIEVPNRLDRRQAVIQHWNAAMEIRLSYHLGIPATEAFDNVAAKFDHGAVITGDLTNINFPEIDALFYVGRYDPEDTDNWCQEMQ